MRLKTKGDLKSSLIASIRMGNYVSTYKLNDMDYRQIKRPLL